MNKKLVVNILGKLLLLEALLMLPSLVVALIYKDGDALSFIGAIIPLVILGFAAQKLKPENSDMDAREGLAVSGLAWILLSLFGAVPFVLSGAIPSFIDAWFECVSGFTTTGASILTDVEALGHGTLFWRSFTHWVGGMGVLVLTLALLPKLTGRASHLARAESPGPTFSKFTPKLQVTAKILYVIYIVMTIIEAVLLLIAGMPLFDSILHAFGTAGTGGFGIKNLSIGYYDNAAVDTIITVFMVLFGINFVVYFNMLKREFRAARRNEEMLIYLGVFAVSVGVIIWQIYPQYGSFFTSLRYSSFQVASIMSTTGYSTANFDAWPMLARAVLVCLMLIGACAGSTAGGFKVVRVTLLFKATAREIRHTFRPRRTEVVRMDGKPVSEPVINQLMAYLFLYVVLILVGVLLLSGFGYDFETAFTAPIACVSNIGPGLSLVGPMGNFSFMHPVCKIYMSILMLAGRLELYPILLLMYPSFWKKRGF